MSVSTELRDERRRSLLAYLATEFTRVTVGTAQAAKVAN